MTAAAENLQEEYTVEKIVQIRTDERTGQHQVLVQWEDYELDEDGWEPLKAITEDVPLKMIEFLDRHWSETTKEQREVISKSVKATFKRQLKAVITKHNKAPKRGGAM
eukprot:GHVU01079752.1.p3 GENE.GHVU01079752.1~~GHVU01079752.1.p3  ORF type:complete len:108 (-),score=27.41 GHVU01079752.1:9-332(-)